MKIGCAVLAGGKSSRMGQDKALLAYNGNNFIQILCNVLSSFEERIIARGSRSELPLTDWIMIPDVYPDKGPLGGLHAVLSACESDAVFFVSCDMPLLQKSLVDYLCSFMDEEVDAVISVTNDGWKHPLCGVYKKSVAPLAEEQIESGRYSLMALLDKLRVKCVNLDASFSSQLANINTLEDYDLLV